jgi:phosphoglycolate phosphatase-like HAD superfamily hydrolase
MLNDTRYGTVVNVLLDLDGTLTDPREGILACLRHFARSDTNRPRIASLNALLGRRFKTVSLFFSIRKTKTK